MDREGQQVHITDEEASGGRKQGVVRYILIIGTGLAVILLGLVWIVPALTTSAEEHVSVSRRIGQEKAAGEPNDAALAQDADTTLNETEGRMEGGVATVPNANASPD